MKDVEGFYRHGKELTRRDKAEDMAARIYERAISNAIAEASSWHISSAHRYALAYEALAAAEFWAERKGKP